MAVSHGLASFVTKASRLGYTSPFFPLSTPSHSFPVVLSFLLSFSLNFCLVLSLVLSFSISRKLDATRLFGDSDSVTNGSRILVSKRVPHPEETCLQHYLLRLALLLLRLWLVHPGMWSQQSSTRSDPTIKNRQPMPGLPVSTPSSGRSGLLVAPVLSWLSMEA